MMSLCLICVLASNSLNTNLGDDSNNIEMGELLTLGSDDVQKETQGGNEEA